MYFDSLTNSMNKFVFKTYWYMVFVGQTKLLFRSLNIYYIYHAFINSHTKLEKV